MIIEATRLEYGCVIIHIGRGFVSICASAIDIGTLSKDDEKDAYKYELSVKALPGMGDSAYFCL